MKIKRFIGGALQSNGYVIYVREGGSCYIIDPGYRHNRFLDFVKENSLSVNGVLLTHYHYDHTGAVKNICSALGCSAYMFGDDRFRYKEATEPLHDGQIIDLDGEKIEVLSTPGHTAGGVCFYSAGNRVAFTGDTVFNVDLGRTDLESGSQKELEESVRNVTEKWPGDVTIYPGHGDPCSMSYVRKENREYIEIINGGQK